MNQFENQQSHSRPETTGYDKQMLARYEQWIDTMRQEERSAVSQKMREVFGRGIPDREFADLFTIPYHSITNDCAVSTNKALAVFAFQQTRVPAVEIVNMLYIDSDPIGAVHFTCLRENDITLEIRHRYLSSEKRGHGIGIDIDWRLQQFCRQYGIPAMYNEAQTSPSHNGAYVWALYGYEFANTEACDLLYKQLKYYALAQQVKLSHDPRFFDRPIEFANAKGTDANGVILPIGKMLLTNPHKRIVWRGRRDVALESDGVHDFIAYAKKRGRDDIVLEYEKLLKR